MRPAEHFSGSRGIAVFELDASNNLYTVLIPRPDFDMVIHAAAGALDPDHCRGLLLMKSEGQRFFIVPGRPRIARIGECG